MNLLLSTTSAPYPGRMLPVTHPASTPSVSEFQHLLHGIDSLDLGLYVAWGSDWKRRLHSLDKKKQQARRNGALLISMPSGRNCIFKPGGKGENYRFHLQFDAYNLFIGKSATPGTSPNVYLSISAKVLWHNGIETALSWIALDLKAIGGGTIQRVQVSRLDLCADFLVPGGLSHEFILSHKVTRNDKGKLYLDKNELQTYYAADGKSPIQLRLYNKGLEVKQGGIKLWFLDLWKRESTDDIWRIEFQVRRPALKQFGINSIDDLKEKQAGLWGYLTMKWFSLRLPDNDKAERKTVHPFWSAVQECFKNDISGTCSQAYRNCVTLAAASPEWHLSHIDGCLSSFAAILGISNREEALQELQSRLTKRNNAADFETACIKKAIQRGTSGGGQ
ncbi:MAG: plasmid replication initiation factor [Desulfuromonadaceae bacterium]|nr:plasmid replication initiation factor [Desulfuromonadaceae bacterium]MDD2854762.1 plasmid replication initiation factor [Desulfuromonadaceae bacterium]